MAAVIRVEASLARHALELLGTRRDVVEVRSEEGEAVALGDPEGEAALLLGGVLGGVDVVRPGEAVAAEGVVDGVVSGDGEGDGLGGVGAGEGEAAAAELR